MSLDRDANPKYRRIAQDLRAKIGVRYAPGDYLPSVRTLQRHYDASVKTVRQAISLLARDGLVVSLPNRGTVVSPDPSSPRPTSVSISAEPPSSRGLDAMAAVPATSARKTVAFLIPLSSHVPPLALEAERELRRHGLRMQLCGNADLPCLERGDREGAQAYEREVLESVARDDVAGVIWWSVFGVPCRESARRLLDRGIPIVLLDSLIPHLSADWVGIDDFGASIQATKHLLRLGHKDIVFLADAGGDYIYPVSRERMHGFLDAMHQADPVRYASYRTLPVDLHFDYEAELFSLLPPALRDSLYLYDMQSDATIEALFARTPRPTAVVAGNDHVAYSLLERLQARGMRAPRDLAIVSFGGADRQSDYYSTLTTIRQPIDQMGARAVRLLLQRLRQPDQPFRHIHLPVQLVVRGSCGTQAPMQSKSDDGDPSDRAVIAAL